MNLSKSITFSIFILLVFSTFMAIAGIRAFSRLAPNIDQINKHNTQSLYLIDRMLTAGVSSNIKMFEENLKKERENITEPFEEEKIENIEASYKKAFTGDVHARNTVIVNLTELAEINRFAMTEAARNAKNLSTVGIWVITFMMIIIWSVGIAVLTNMRTTLIKPLDELEDVLDKVAKGNKLRRCPTVAPTKDFQKIYDGINNLLDK